MNIYNLYKQAYLIAADFTELPDPNEGVPNPFRFQLNQDEAAMDNYSPDNSQQQGVMVNKLPQNKTNFLGKNTEKKDRFEKLLQLTQK
jgi:hypothetical protein